MQYVGKVGDYVYNQWNSLNPATLSGAIDILVIEHLDGSLHCSPWHVRFGKFRIIKPLQKKIDLFVNGVQTDLPMKLGDGGEAFFVFETDSTDLLLLLMTSPVVSATSSPETSPAAAGSAAAGARGEPEALDLNRGPDRGPESPDRGPESPVSVAESPVSEAEPPVSEAKSPDQGSESPDQGSQSLDQKHGSAMQGRQLDASADCLDTSKLASLALRITFEKVKRITQDLNIPLKIDANGDVILDMDGYKPNSQKNIDSSVRLVHDIFLREIQAASGDTGSLALQGAVSGGLEGPMSELHLLQSLIRKDADGQIRLVSEDAGFGDAGFGDAGFEDAGLGDAGLGDAGFEDPGFEDADFKDAGADHAPPLDAAPAPEKTAGTGPQPAPESADPSPGAGKTYIKTLRLTSEQLLNLGLQYGRNRVEFRLSQGGAQVVADLYLWKSNCPIVISDIDGTITKSDALGHVLNMFGRDWTHPGVANLFQDITRNGYNILYLTARSVGQADTTRQYLDSINQDGMRLPKGPVILSPDRTMAALHREIILKKPEVFKMACLRDINSLFFAAPPAGREPDLAANDRTPFYAGFGNRITDAISYRSVQIPSHRIFTINPNGEVHMELLELAGYRLSYLHIGELVDQFFPPLKYISDFSHGWNQHQLDQYIHSKDTDLQTDSLRPASPRLPLAPGSPRSVLSEERIVRPDERFTDLNYWREPMANLSDLTDSDDVDDDAARSVKSSPPSPQPQASSPPASPRLASSLFAEDTSPKQERPVSASFTSPLKNFMIRGGNSTAAPKPMKSPLRLGPEALSGAGDLKTPGRLSDEDDDYTDDDYEDDDYGDEEDEYEDDDEDDDDYDDDDDEEDEDDDEEDEDDDEYDDEDDQDFDVQDDELKPKHGEGREDHAKEEGVDSKEEVCCADPDVDEHANQEVDHDDLDLDANGQEVDDEDLDLDDGLPEKCLSFHASSEPPVKCDGEDYRIMTASDMLKGLDI
ncbi:LNS2-domain-containing protein [Metschnikowia bicuspidata var. bicuspidata NRRL YB-4993]|uniref:LNS2-domain-containing protein n=1 Tax=Metschnikowia bicuspidata var. bicuspidata NRRL YB-4993 TaxID=869754 RepID=A0A1A0H8Q2_9ASCO|nr:LNS2-domain-containing protein [Metschnikowia bicuspidata var. bicuspidata NRRL YB-4993]OBA20391.1 LNS2-domain-containing protein [Metschnikowia bicuspidata var. bicuspidata NRRL YB-4993]